MQIIYSNNPLFIIIFLSFQTKIKYFLLVIENLKFRNLSKVHSRIWKFFAISCNSEFSNLGKELFA